MWTEPRSVPVGRKQVSRLCNATCHSVDTFLLSRQCVDFGLVSTLLVNHKGLEVGFRSDEGLFDVFCVVLFFLRSCYVWIVLSCRAWIIQLACSAPYLKELAFFKKFIRNEWSIRSMVQGLLNVILSLVEWCMQNKYWKCGYLCNVDDCQKELCNSIDVWCNTNVLWVLIVDLIIFDQMSKLHHVKEVQLKPLKNTIPLAFT